jgi:hypothetical protein
MAFVLFCVIIYDDFSNNINGFFILFCLIIYDDLLICSTLMAAFAYIGVSVRWIYPPFRLLTFLQDIALPQITGEYSSRPVASNHVAMPQSSIAAVISNVLS